MHAAVALAADGDVALFAQPHVLQHKCTNGEGQQNDGQHGGATLVVLRTHDGKKYVGGQDTEIAAQHQGVAEVRHALYKTQQKGIGQARTHQRPGDRSECHPVVGAQGLRGLFHGRADGLDHTNEHHETDGRKSQQLRQKDAPEAIDPARWLNPENLAYPLGNHTREAQQQNHRQADDERRRDDGQQGQGFEKALEGHARAGQHQRKRQAQHGTAQPDGNSQSQ